MFDCKFHGVKIGRYCPQCVRVEGTAVKPETMKVIQPKEPEPRILHIDIRRSPHPMSPEEIIELLQVNGDRLNSMNIAEKTIWLRSTMKALVAWVAKEGLRRHPMPTVARYYSELLEIAKKI